MEVHFRTFNNITEINSTPEVNESTLQYSDMIFQITFAGSNLIFNAVAFLIFYFGNQKYSNVTNLMMSMCLSESINYYCVMMILYDLPAVIDFLKVRRIFSFLTLQGSNRTDNYYSDYISLNRTIQISDPFDTFDPKVYTLAKINNSIYSAGVSCSLCLQICFCFEIIYMFKDPISDFSKRHKLYFLFTFIMSICSYLLSYFYSVDDNMTNLVEHGYRKIFMVFWDSQEMNIAILFIYFLVAVFTVFNLINIVRSKSKFHSREKIMFCFFQIAYISLYSGMWIYSLVYYFDRSGLNLPVLLSVLNGCGFVLTVFRVIEMGNCLNCSVGEIEDEKTNEMLHSRNNSFNDIRFSDASKRSNEEEIGNNNESFFSNNNNKLQPPVKIDLPLSALLTNSFLSEYMYYIINGILCIGKEVSTKKQQPYFIHKENYSEVCYHTFHQINMRTVKDLIENSNFSIKSVIKSSLSKCDLLSLSGICDRSIRIIEYSPKVFRNILALDSLDYEELFKSFEVKKNVENLSKLSISEGKSGSFFFFTHDHRFLIKTISDTELTTLREDFLQPYYELVTENYNTLLGRTYGVYTLAVGLSRITVILMENISPIENSYVIRRFDLKGSLLGRKTKNINLYQKSRTLKDHDYLDFKRMYPDLINFEDKSLIAILETLKYDLNLLRNSSLMDYSFFITICDRKNDFDINTNLVSNRAYVSRDEKHIYFIGIIDYLTVFSNYKQIENKYKTLINYSKRQYISSVNPVMYAERLSNFISQELFNIK